MNLINHKINYRAMLRRLHDRGIQSGAKRADFVNNLFSENYQRGRKTFVNTLLRYGQSPFRFAAFKHIDHASKHY